mgnify:CR=1 FL=1
MVFFALIAAIMAIDGGAINVAIGLILAALTLFADADTQRRTGNSLIQQQPGYFSSLFAASFVIGWCCYWLNLYLQLWTYPAATETVPFVLGKSLYYALLLPAVLSLRQWLASWPLLLDLTSRARPRHIQTTPGQGIVLFGMPPRHCSAHPYGRIGFTHWHCSHLCCWRYHCNRCVANRQFCPALPMETGAASCCQPQRLLSSAW